MAVNGVKQAYSSHNRHVSSQATVSQSMASGPLVLSLLISELYGAPTWCPQHLRICQLTLTFGRSD